VGLTAITFLPFICPGCSTCPRISTSTTGEIPKDTKGSFTIAEGGEIPRARKRVVLSGDASEQ